MDKEEIIRSLKEMREVCAVCFRIIGQTDKEVDLLEDELNRIGIKHGFGLRCQELIKKLSA